jgi:HEAT repeat protein
MTMNNLIQELQHLNRDVRSQAALGLGRLGDSSALDALIAAIQHEQDFFVREDLTWALVRMGETAIQPLIDLLQEANPATRHQAAHVLGKINDVRATDALIEALQDTNPEVVAKAAFTLGQFGDVKAIPALIAQLGHENRDVQETLIDVLERFGVAAVQPLIASLQSENPQVRELAADILGLLRSRDAIPALIELLKDEHWQVRFAALTAFGHIGSPKTKEAIQSMNNDPEPRVRALVPKMLRRIKG